MPLPIEIVYEDGWHTQAQVFSAEGLQSIDQIYPGLQGYIQVCRGAGAVPQRIQPVALIDKLAAHRICSRWNVSRNIPKTQREYPKLFRSQDPKGFYQGGDQIGTDGNYGL